MHHLNKILKKRDSANETKNVPSEHRIRGLAAYLVCDCWVSGVNSESWKGNWFGGAQIYRFYIYVTVGAAAAAAHMCVYIYYICVIMQQIL